MAPPYATQPDEFAIDGERFGIKPRVAGYLGCISGCGTCRRFRNEVRAARQLEALESQSALTKYLSRFENFDGEYTFDAFDYNEVYGDDADALRDDEDYDDLTFEIEADGSISSVYGGPLEEAVSTGATEDIATLDEAIGYIRQYAAFRGMTVSIEFKAY